MKKQLLFVALLFIAAVSFAQTKTITGKITDGANKEPLIGATIVAKGTQIGTATDEKGAFKIDVPSETKILTVSYVGYDPKDVQISNSTVLNVALETAFVPGGEVVVTSSRVAESIKTASVQIEKMTSREIKSAASGDFYQSIGNFKGIDMVTSSAGFKVINLRGFSDTRSLRTKQFIDGVDNEAPGLNFPVGNLVGANDLDLESVEIVSGAASALYGANAMQGVVSMTTKSPYDHKGLSLQIKGGATTIPGPYFDGQFRYANTFGKEDRFAIKFTGQYVQMRDWEANDPDLNNYGDISTDINLSSILRERALEPYGPGTDITVEEHNDFTKLNAWLDFNPAANPGILNVKAPGYLERHLADYNSKSLKFSTSLHYRFKNDMELSGTYKFGYGTAVYQATARYQIKDFTFHQPMIQLKGKNFFVRAFGAFEDAGNSYNIGLTGSYLSRSAASDYVSKWSEKYFDVLDTLTGFCADCVGSSEWAAIIANARGQANAHANNAWYTPGSQMFRDTFNALIKDPNSLTGTRFFDKSSMVNLEGQYNWDFVKWMEIITGASYRLYLPNSRGTIFEDTAGIKFRVHEVGAYIQATKRLFNDNFKIIGSVRVDKNSNFKAQVSPRGSLVYTAKAKNSDHTFRASVSSAFRTPTLQDIYLYLDIGRIVLVGNRTGYDNLFTRESVLEYYRNPQIGDQPNIGLLQSTTIKPLRPERALGVDFGYRAEVAKKLYIDLSAYYTRYSSFIGFQRVVRTDRGNANADEDSPEYQNASDDIILNDSLNTNETYQTLQMWVNSDNVVPSWGVAVSASYYVGKGITPYVNYTYSDLDDSQVSNSGATVLSGFNTPRHKFNIGVSGNRVWKGLGFSANFKWVTSYEWQSPFADGVVPSFHTLDAQISYEIDKIYSTVRIGGSNLYNRQRIEAVGAPNIGAMYYASWSFDFANFGKK
jgi:outer membrane receptor protein involved in Fe transport